MLKREKFIPPIVAYSRDEVFIWQFFVPASRDEVFIWEFFISFRALGGIPASVAEIPSRRDK
jgi:hypothetical protein